MSPAQTARHPLNKSGEPDAIPELRFRVMIGNQSEIGRFSECTGLNVEYEVLEYHEGGNNDYVHKFRGRAKFPNLVLKRGITSEDALMKWFEECHNQAKRKEILVQLLSPMGTGEKEVRQWSFKEAFPIKWTGPNLNAGSNNLATESLEIAHHGFSRGT